MFDNGAMQVFRLAAALALLAVSLHAAVTATRQGERIDIVISGAPFTSFHFNGDDTKPYLHPLRAADGSVVTRSYPMEDVDGEQRDHPHHRGAWFSHGAVNGVDFWANEVGQRGRGDKGTISLEDVLEAESGEHTAHIEAQLAWNGPDGERLLTERRLMRFGRSGGDNFVDFDIVLEAATESVRFGDTKEGAFAVRLATELEEPHWRARGIERTGRIVNAQGIATEANTWGKRSPWVDYSGALAGKPVGVAIFDHPANPKHPTYWHVRGYGLFAANVFGEHDFHQDESRDGSITIAKGETLRFRFRILIHAGRTDEAEIGRKYEAWSQEQRK